VTGEGDSLDRWIAWLETTTLTGWTPRDQHTTSSGSGTFKLAAGKSVTIHTGKGSGDRNDLYWGSSEYVWNNDGDRATLNTRGGHCRYL
jgi:hypothetical protein